MGFELVSGLAQLVAILLVLHEMGKPVFMCALCKSSILYLFYSACHRILAQGLWGT